MIEQSLAANAGGPTGLHIEGIPIAIRAFGDAAVSPLGTPPKIETGIIDDVLSNIGWEREEMPLFTVPEMTPCTILAIEYELESS